MIKFWNRDIINLIINDKLINRAIINNVDLLGFEISNTYNKLIGNITYSNEFNASNDKTLYNFMDNIGIDPLSSADLKLTIPSNISKKTSYVYSKFYTIPNNMLFAFDFSKNDYALFELKTQNGISILDISYSKNNFGGIQIDFDGGGKNLTVYESSNFVAIFIRKSGDYLIVGTYRDFGDRVAEDSITIPYKSLSRAKFDFKINHSGDGDTGLFLGVYDSFMGLPQIR